MEYFIAKNVADMTVAADYSSSLDSQAIAGVAVTGDKEEKGYVYVRTPDGYHGWISKLRLADGWDISPYKKMCVKTLFAEVYSQPDLMASSLLSRLVISTCLPLVKDSQESYLEIILPDKQKGYVEKACFEYWDDSPMNDNVVAQKWQDSKEAEREEMVARLGQQIANKARLFIGTPYLWGGCTPFGIDCSGLSQLVYRLNGIQLLRNSYMQCDDKRFFKIEIDKKLDESNFQAGDILFFDTRDIYIHKINHTGIACGDGSFVEASGHSRQGRVVLNPCDDPFFKERYLGAVRLSPKADIRLAAAN